MAAIDYYRVLNITRTASAKEIKAAYFHLAKSLHPDVTGNDETKAERFKHVSEAHSVLADPQSRRQYDASLPTQNFHSYDTSGMTQHPYAAAGGASGFRTGPYYGINEEVWLAHHYGPEAVKRDGMPPRYYGMDVLERKLEEQRERIRRRQRHFKMGRTSGYFMRREARLRKHEEQQAEQDEKREEEKKSNDGCVIS